MSEYKKANGDITKDGHTMFLKDIAKELNRASHVEKLLVENRKEIDALKTENESLKDIIVAHNIADETGYIDGVGWVNNWSEMEAKVIQLRDKAFLEQQAKGIDWVLGCREMNLSEGEVHALMDRCNQLLEQAKES